MPQEYGLSLECVCVCALRLLLSAKALLHWLHWNGFSPVWVLMWPWSSHGLEKFLPQKGQRQPALVGTWDLMCTAREAAQLNSFMQWLQVWGASGWDCCGELKLSIMRIWGVAYFVSEELLLPVVRSRGSDWTSLEMGEGVRAGDLEVDEEEERLLGEEGLGETEESLVAKPGL